jgi:hypothetical protein
MKNYETMSMGARNCRTGKAGTRGVNVLTSRFARTKRETQRFFYYVGTAKCGTQTKFLTFQYNFRENITFRYVSLE